MPAALALTGVSGLKFVSEVTVYFCDPMKGNDCCGALPALSVAVTTIGFGTEQPVEAFEGLNRATTDAPGA
jgi:hypothetical protein